MNREEIEKRLPTEEDIRSFEQNGWYATPQIIPDELLDHAVKGAEAFYAGHRDFELNTSEKIANSASTESVLKNNEFVSLQKEEIRQLAFYPLVSATAARLVGAQEMRLFSDSLICKYPSNGSAKGSIGWHSDKAYWPTCSSDKLITAWIPFQDCTVEMGTLVHLEGSHLWQNDPELRALISFNDHKMNDFESYIEKHRPNTERKLMLLKKGQVSFHSCLTLHASYPNVSDRNRMALAVHMQDADNTYQKAWWPDGNPVSISYDAMCAKDSEGNPDYSDPKLFPVMWTENA